MLYPVYITAILVKISSQDKFAVEFYNCGVIVCLSVGASREQLSAVVWADFTRCLGCCLESADDVIDALDSCRELPEQALIQQLSSSNVRDVISYVCCS